VGHIAKKKKKDGQAVYYAEVRLKGFPYVSKKFEARDDAKQWIQATESDFRRGKSVNIGEASTHTLADAIDRYLNVYLAQYPHRLQKQRQLLSWWKNRIGDLILAKVSPAVISELRDKLASEKTYRGTVRSGSTVNRYLAAISKVLTLCVREWCWLEVSPMPRVGKLKESSGKTRFLSVDEVKRLLDECKNSKNEHLYPVVLMAVTLGMRYSEIVTLEWDQVDLDAGFVHLQHTKNGTDRIVPISKEISALLQDLKNKSSDQLVFPLQRRIGNTHGRVLLRSAFEGALKEAGINEATFHTLRHTAASHFAMQGANTSALMSLLGHKSPVMSKRYTHFADKYLKNIVQQSTERLINDKSKESM
jgi:integrase